MSKQTVPYIALQLTPGGQRCWTSITKLSFWNCSQDFQSREHIGLDRWLIAVNSYDGYYLIQPIAQINSEPCPSANKIPSWAILPRGNGLHFGLILRDSEVKTLVVCNSFDGSFVVHFSVTKVFNQWGSFLVHLKWNEPQMRCLEALHFWFIWEAVLSEPSLNTFINCNIVWYS